MEEKEIRGWLIVDYKTGHFRCAKKLRGTRSSLKASEIPIEISLKVQIPDVPLMKAEGQIKLSHTQLTNMMIESLSEQSDTQ